MKTLLTAVAAALLLTSCGSSDDGPTRAVDRSGSHLAGIPAASGTVTTRGVATVLDTGTPELCLGPVAESLPPQCDGLPLAGWRWTDHHASEASGRTRWGAFAVTGTWDGTTFSSKGAVSGALYDPAAPEPTVRPTPAVRLDDARLADVLDRLTRELPGFLTGYPEGGQVLVDVVYDDGSLQRWADDTFGAGVVVLTSMLVDAG